MNDNDPRKAAIDEADMQDFESWHRQYFKGKMPEYEKKMYRDCFLDARSTKYCEWNQRQKLHDASTIRAYLTNPPEEAVEEIAKGLYISDWLDRSYGKVVGHWEGEIEFVKNKWMEKARALLKRMAEKKGE